LWRKFCDGFGLDPDIDGHATNAERVVSRKHLITTIEVALASWDGEALLAMLGELEVPAGKVRSLDVVYSWDRVLSQGLLLRLMHPGCGQVDLPGPRLRVFDERGDEFQQAHVAPPAFDEHGDAIRGWLRAAADERAETGRVGGDLLATWAIETDWACGR